MIITFTPFNTKKCHMCEITESKALRYLPKPSPKIKKKSINFKTVKCILTKIKPPKQKDGTNLLAILFSLIFLSQLFLSILLHLHLRP